MAAVSEIFPRLLPYAPACPEPMAEQCIVDAAIEFCEKTNAFRYTPDQVSTTAGLTTYDFDLPSFTDFARVIHLSIDSKEIQSVVTEAQPLEADYQTKPDHYFVTQNESELLLNLYPTPDDVYTIDMSIALRPTRNATQIDDDLYTYWQDAIICGALYRIMSVPGQAFSDPVNAGYYNRKFHVLMNNARNEGNLGRVVGSMRVRSNPFVRPRSYGR